MTLISVKHVSNSSPVRFGNWRIDDDGFLRVTARIIKEGVYPYAQEESSEKDVRAHLPGIDPIMQYIPLAEFTDGALASLEGKPVTVPLVEDGEEWHQWRKPENALKDFLTVGAIAGRPYVDDEGGVSCDMLIMEPGAIRAITEEQDPEKKLVEVSAGYMAMLDINAGDFEGVPYHGTQKDLHFNHVLLLPEGMGRCGYDVRIINSRGAVPPAEPPIPHRAKPDSVINSREPNSGKQSEGAGNMPTTLKVTVGNRARSYKFQNEEDAAQAEEMLNEEKSFNAEAVSAAISAKTELETQIADLQKQLAEHDQHLADAKRQIEELLTPAAQEAMAEEYVEQKDAEDAIIDAETDNMEGGDSEKDAEEEKEDFGNALKKCDSMAERRQVAVTRVMNMRGMKVDGWNQDAFDGAFEMLAANAKAKAKSKEKSGRVLNGARTPGKGGAMPAGNRERMLRPMKARNAKPEAQK